LIDLSHQRLDNKVLYKLIDRYRSGSNPMPRYDRALVLISGAFIEQALEAVIKLAIVMEYDGEALNTDLFGGDRPGAINGFYGKIILGHALGAYPLAFKQDLDQIRHIRNAFAHAKGEISFQTAEVANACQFHCVNQFSEGENSIPFKTARDRYVFMAFFAVLTFELKVKDMGGDSARPSSYSPDEVLP
jgi:hypothetical protein